MKKYYKTKGTDNPVSKWWIEYDEEKHCVTREIGFDINGNAVRYSPSSIDNYGVWTDNNIVYTSNDVNIPKNSIVINLSLPDNVEIDEDVFRKSWEKINQE